jgi:hypothetical protein
MSKVWTPVNAVELRNGDNVKALNENGSTVFGIFDNDDFAEGWGAIAGVPTRSLATADYVFYVEQEKPGLPTTPGSVVRIETRWGGPLGLMVLDDDRRWGNYQYVLTENAEITNMLVIFDAGKAV